MNEFFQERAALYVSGMMTAQEREEFELVLEFHDELRAFTAGLAEVGTSVTLVGLRSTRFRPTLEGKARRRPDEYCLGKSRLGWPFSQHLYARSHMIRRT